MGRYSNAASILSSFPNKLISKYTPSQGPHPQPWDLEPNALIGDLTQKIP